MEDCFEEQTKYKIVALSKKFNGFFLIDRAAGIDIKNLVRIVKHLKLEEINIVFANDVQGFRVVNLENYSKERTE